MTDQFEDFDIYDVVSEPTRYDAFMRALLKKVENLNDKTANDQTGGDQTGIVDNQWDKASKLVSRVTPWRVAKESNLDKFLGSKIQAVMASDDMGTIVSANYAAQGLYNLNRKAALSDLPLSKKHHAKLLDNVSALIKDTGLRNSPNNVLRFQNCKTKTPLLLTLTKHIDDSTESSHVVIMTNELHWPPHLGPILSDLFNLTQAEIEVTRLMVLGASVDDMKQKRATSTATIRSQLRSIFTKTDTGSQIECLRMVLGLAMMHDPNEGKLIASRIQAGIENSAYPRDEQRHIFYLQNGRQIDYSVFGASTAKRKGVVLFYHAPAMGDIWFKGAVKEATRAGLQIIAPLRPGFGRTSLYEGTCSDPHVFAQQVKELLDHLNIQTAALMTLNDGFVHGLAAAKLMPDRFTSIIAASPAFPVTCEADMEGTHGYSKLVPKTRLRFPHALRFICKAGFAYVSAKGPSAFVEAFVHDAPKDLAWARRPEIMSVLVTAVSIYRVHGYLGTYGDIAYGENWKPLIQDSTMPIRLVLGEHDRNTQWGAARAWASTQDNIEMHVLPDSGYMVQHQHPGQFLNWLKQDLGLKYR